jgi:hypothetical protein
MDMKFAEWHWRIPYDPAEKEKYAANDRTGLLYKVRWNPAPISDARELKQKSVRPGEGYFRKALGGRASHGEFPVVFVREYFRWLGYTVWASEPRLVHPSTRVPEGYVLLSYPGARNQQHRHHHAYDRMARIFGFELLKTLNEQADKAKISLKGNRGGGDPDLFVFKGDGKKERFFVEVKENDPLLPVQKLCFPLIEKNLQCAVRICRICPIQPMAIYQPE